LTEEERAKLKSEVYPKDDFDEEEFVW